MKVQNDVRTFGSFIRAAPLGKIDVALDQDGSEYRATLTACGQEFFGTGQRPVLALQAMMSVITESAIYPGLGRPTDRLRVAATLLHLPESPRLTDP